jgi:hypothetical protein
MRTLLSWCRTALAIVLAVVATATVALPRSAQAAAKEAYPYGYVAKELTRSAKSFEVAAGETFQFTIAFKNTGTATWYREGKNYVSAYTHGPRYRKSDFRDSSWLGDTQPARLKEDVVKPGQVGTVTFTLFAPLKAGTYKETFALAAEGRAFHDGGLFSVHIVVDPKKQLLADQEALPGMKLAPGFKAQMLLVSERSLALSAGQSTQFRVGFKNVGRTAWKKGETAVRAVSQIPLRFRDASWNNSVVAPLTADVQPGQLAFFTISLAAPAEGGSFTPAFNLAHGEDLIEGGEVEIPVEVRENKVPAQVDPTVPGSPLAAPGNRGPNIRVGVYFLDLITEQVRVTANGSYTLYDGAALRVQPLSGLTVMTYDPATHRYRVENGSFAYTPSSYPRLVPDDPANTVMEILSLDERASWDPSVNFNKFRGSLELRYNDKKKRAWVIEELPLEDYMRGLAETSNGSPMEYQKALVTAARTYAAYIIELGGKHASEYFNVNRTGDDQVYKGYVSELVRPNVVKAVEETRGQVVTHNGDVVVTPYFSRSDGRTRSWSEVWNGAKPWLVGKPAEYDKAAGRALWGHGVGMSANDALDRAKAGALWQDILKYYYTGIALTQLY